MKFEMVIKEIESILAECNNSANRIRGYEGKNVGIITEINSKLLNTIDRMAPNDVHKEQARKTVGTYQISNDYCIDILTGILKAICDDYKFDRIKYFVEIAHANLFSSFVDMADYLSKEGYKDAAAVIIGSTLEAHLKELCNKSNILTIDSDGKEIKSTKLNEDLKKAGVYTLSMQKQITAWQDIRNDAAHAKYKNYSKEQVEMMISGIRTFIIQYPA